MKNTEVLAPGGSLDHALWALEGGAQAVYVGLKQFSARSHAANLSLDDLSLLTARAKELGARVFCAINTIITAAEIPEALRLVWDVHYRGADAVILQDLGFAALVRRHGPPIDLHASTQAAVHTPSGVAALKAMGFCRVVLARELTMAEIGAIVRADPTMEYEVFVHGALCYAVSGNCMASGVMIGRSANRGDCGQVCRTKFQLDYLIPGPRRRDSPHEAGLPEGIHAPPGEITWKQGVVGTFASMHDLELGARIRELRDLGVQSFKIEGRMKPPAYSYNTARAYRAFLDGGQDDQAWLWLDEARVRYGRLPSPGWFDGHKGLSQINSHWAGTLGLPLGVVNTAKGTDLTVTIASNSGLLKALSLGDGVMILGHESGASHRCALAARATLTKDGLNLRLTERPPFDAAEGTVWLISKHDGKLPVKKATKFFRYSMDLAIRLDAKGQLTIATTLAGGLSLTSSVPLETAHGGKDVASVIAEIFRASDSRFQPGEFTVTNEAGAVFMDPKILKQLRRDWYAQVETKLDTWITDQTRQFAAPTTGPVPGSLRRSQLSPTEGVNQLVGFVVEWEKLTAAQLAATDYGLALPWAPFTPDEAGYLDQCRAFLDRLRAANPGATVFPGLSNPAHIVWLHQLRAEGYPVANWFADWGFHAANPWTARALADSAPGLVQTVHWLEDPACPDQSYFPPLFTSRACMLRNSFAELQPQATPTSGTIQFDSRAWIERRAKGQALERPTHGPRCPDGCAGHFSARLSQGDRQFRVEARDCTNYLIAVTDAPQAKT